MRLPRIAHAICLASASTLALAAEPPTRLQVKIGDARLFVDAGELAEITVDGKRVKVLIEELPTRRFDQAGVRFEYPRQFAWEEEDGLWRVNGNVTHVIVLRRSSEGSRVTPAKILDVVAEDLRRTQPTKRIPVVLETRRGPVAGLATTVRLASSLIRYEAYVLEQDDAQISLILHGNLDANRKRSAEFIDMRKRLVDTLEF